MSLSPPKVVTQTKSLSSRNNHVAQTLRAATTAVAASGLPFRVPGFREVQGLCVESFLQGHQDWLVHGQPGRWMAEATTVWVVLGDLTSRSAQQQPCLRPLASSPARSSARGRPHRACPADWLRSPSSALSDKCPLNHQLAFLIGAILDNCIH